MTAKDIHDALFSLVIRSMGVWLLYESYSSFLATGDVFYWALFSSTDGNGMARKPDWSEVYFLIWHLLPAVYLLLGAPPFLRIARQSKLLG